MIQKDFFRIMYRHSGNMQMISEYFVRFRAGSGDIAETPDPHFFALPLSPAALPSGSTRFPKAMQKNGKFAETGWIFYVCVLLYWSFRDFCG